MPIELRILSGARAGHTESFEKSVIAIGRHPMSDFRFDPKQDLDVSTRHGEIRLVGGVYTILDSNSTNGTFVNGQRVTPGGTQELRNSDVIAFGAHGPTVSVTLSGAVSPLSELKAPAEPVKPAAPAASIAPPPSAPASPPAGPATSTPPSPTTQRPSGKKRRNTAERVAIAVREQTRRLWVAIAVIVLVLGGTATAIFIRSAAQDKASKAAIAKLLEANEAITKSFQDRLRQGDTALANRMRHVNDSLVRALRQATSTAQMAAAEAALKKHNELQQQITDMDYAAISRANDPAVVLIASEMGGPGPLEATGFCVRSNGLIVTNRHVVLDSTTRSSGIRVKFANTGRWYRAHVVKLPDNASTDLALIQIDESGKFPTVSALASSVDTPVGASVVTIGFPLGTDLPMDGSAAKTSATFGNVSKVVPDLLQIDAFATHGSSGSPVFDSHGHVIGVVKSGVSERIVFSVPVERLDELLRSAGR